MIEDRDRQIARKIKGTLIGGSAGPQVQLAAVWFIF